MFTFLVCFLVSWKLRIFNSIPKLKGFTLLVKNPKQFKSFIVIKKLKTSVRAMTLASKLKSFLKVILTSYKISYFQKTCNPTIGPFVHLVS